MPKAYCRSCGKHTAHKMVMKRVQTQPEGWQGFQQFLTMLMARAALLSDGAAILLPSLQPAK